MEVYTVDGSASAPGESTFVKWNELDSTGQDLINYAENAKKGTDENLNNLASYFDVVAETYKKQDEDIREAENEYLNTELFG